MKKFLSGLLAALTGGIARPYHGDNWGNKLWDFLTGWNPIVRGVKGGFNAGSQILDQLGDLDLSGFVPSLVNYFSQENATGRDQELFDLNEQAANNAMQRQENFYNKYQSPMAMNQQYIQAGLNPALMYGNQGSFSSSSAPSGGAVVSGGGQGNFLSGIMSLVALREQIKNYAVERNLKESQALYWQDQSKFLQERTRWLSPLNQSRIDLNTSSIGVNVERVKNLSADTLLKGTENVLKKYQISESDARRALTESQTVLNQIDASKRAEYMDSLIAVNDAKRKLDIATEVFTYRKARLTDVQIQKENAELDLLTDTYQEKVNQAKETTRRLAAEAGIAENQLSWFESDKIIEYMSEIYPRNNFIRTWQYNAKYGIKGSVYNPLSPQQFNGSTLGPLFFE